MPSITSISASPISGTRQSPIYYEDTAPQWLFTPAEFHDLTPSRSEGIPYDIELINRRKGINFITQVGISLKLDQITLATAAIYFQRFYMRHPLQIPGSNKGAHHYQVAATSVYIAYKSKENPRKMHELIVAVSRVAQKDPNLMIDEQSKEFWKWRETIQHHENLMLEVLCFDLDPSLPYQVLYAFLKYYNVQDDKRLRNNSWAVVTDSFTTNLCLFVQPQSIAGGALYLGLKHSGIKLPDDEEGRPWWEALVLDVKEMELVLESMLSTYENPQLKGQAGSEIYTRDPDIMSFHNTRHISPSVDDERTPRDHGHSQTTIEPSQNRVENENGSGSGNGNGNGNAPDMINPPPEADDDQPMEDARNTNDSGSEEGELG